MTLLGWAVSLYIAAGVVASVVLSYRISRKPHVYGEPMTLGEAIACVLLWPMIAFLCFCQSVMAYEAERKNRKRKDK